MAAIGSGGARRAQARGDRRLRGLRRRAPAARLLPGRYAGRRRSPAADPGGEPRAHPRVPRRAGPERADGLVRDALQLPGHDQAVGVQRRVAPGGPARPLEVPVRLPLREDPRVVRDRPEGALADHAGAHPRGPRVPEHRPQHELLLRARRPGVRGGLRGRRAGPLPGPRPAPAHHRGLRLHEARHAHVHLRGHVRRARAQRARRRRVARRGLKFPASRPTIQGMTPGLTPSERFRVVTRSDRDGLVCAALLKHLGILDDILFVHPKDVQDGKVELGPGDVTTNLPYSPHVAISFDHHHSETLRVGYSQENHVIVPGAESAARVVYEYYGGADRFPGIEELMAAVDKGDAAQFTLDEILRPTGWVLLNFLMDPRTGLGRFREFRISNYQLMMQLIDACTVMSVEEILQTPDVAERVELYLEHAERAVEQIKRCATVHGNLVVLDLRDEDVIHPTNRFTIYALFPLCNVSIHVLWGLRQQNTVFATGKSIIDRGSATNVGELMLSYGGGGHEAAGTCQVENADAPRVLGELVGRITSDG